MKAMSTDNLMKLSFSSNNSFLQLASTELTKCAGTQGAEHRNTIASAVMEFRAGRKTSGTSKWSASKVMRMRQGLCVGWVRIWSWGVRDGRASQAEGPLLLRIKGRQGSYNTWPRYC